MGTAPLPAALAVDPYTSGKIALLLIVKRKAALCLREQFPSLQPGLIGWCWPGLCTFAHPGSLHRVNLHSPCWGAALTGARYVVPENPIRGIVLGWG